MRRYAPLQYRQVLLRAPTAALFYISNPTTASTFALACCDDFCQRRAKLYLTYCKRAFGKPQSGKSAQQARANAYFFRRSVACIGNSSTGPLTQSPHFGGRCLEINYKLQISVILRHFDQANSLRHFDQAKRVEKSPRKRPSYNCVIARSERSAAEISLCRVNHFTFCAKQITVVSSF